LAGGEIFDSVRDSGKGAVFISGHFALFEIMPVAILRRGIRCVMTYRPINNPLIDEKVLALRKRYGATLQAAKGREGGMSLLRALKRGEAVALMNDQKYDEGIAAPFFGYDAMTADAPSRLALNFNVPLIPLSVRRLGRARFRVEAHDPIPLERDAPIEIAVRDAVALINQFIEAQVRAAPEQWFWVHKRWPRAAWEKAGLL
jgi:KDO2-lipid IV(A) lauroyltransferase